MAITEGRRLDVRAHSPYPAIAARRQKFEQHLDECGDCQPQMCSVAQAMWRALVLAALRATETTKDGA